MTSVSASSSIEPQRVASLDGLHVVGTPKANLIKALNESLDKIKDYQPLFDEMPKNCFGLGTLLSVKGFDKDQKQQIKKFLDEIPAAKEQLHKLLTAYSSLIQAYDDGKISEQQISKCFVELGNEMNKFLGENNLGQVMESMQGKSDLEKLGLLDKIKDNNPATFDSLMNVNTRLNSVTSQLLRTVMEISNS